MERKLASLFDYQRFQQNPKLQGVIQDVEGHYRHDLSEDDLLQVSAAGTADNPPSSRKTVMVIIPDSLMDGDTP